MIDFELFSTLFIEAEQYDNIDMYIAERGWQDWMNEYSNGTDVDRLSLVLSNIYNLAKMEIKEIRAFENLSQPKFCAIYRVKIRTLQDWEYGNSAIPDAIKTLICYTIFIKSLKDKRIEKKKL